MHIEPSIHNLRGMSDILPHETQLWRYMDNTLSTLLTTYGYSEIRLPLLESSALFERSIGAATELVEKEMYCFDDRNGMSITLRPEGTAGCMRARTQHGLHDNRLWYHGPMFRYERPQQGRMRQFHQLGVETFGMPDADIDAELIALNYRMWQQLGVDAQLTLQLNSIGNQHTRENYCAQLVQWIRDQAITLHPTDEARLTANPLRILDSKDTAMQKLLHDAPQITDFLDDDSRSHFDQLRHILDNASIRYRINPYLVRGLDYYNRTVFEWTTTHLGAQGAVSAGGRYDGLAAQLGGGDVCACGFAIGLDRLYLLLKQHIELHNVPHIYTVVFGDDIFAHAMAQIEQIRTAHPELSIVMHCGDGSLKSQLKKADKSGAILALIIGQNEMTAREMTVRELRTEKSTQHTVSDAHIAQWLNDYFIRHPFGNTIHKKLLQ